MSDREPAITDDIARKAVEVLDIPGGDTTRRAVHTIGTGARGYFVASDVAKDYCQAEFFQGHEIPVTLRFSNGSGLADPHDSRSDVRGLAVRFHLAEGAAADLLAMTLAEFFTPTVETFMDFARATKPAPVKRSPVWEKLLDMMQLRHPLHDPPPGVTMSADAGAMAFADRNAYAILPMFHGFMLGAPTSYARATYYAVHTFIVTAPDGTRRYVRFNWLPVAGVRNISQDAPVRDRYLEQELRDRLAREPVRFTLMMSIGEAGDDFNDSSRSWPPQRVRIVMGDMTINAVADDQMEHGERLSFNPWRLVAGIEPSDDPILRLRHAAYEFSRKRRNGTACPFSGS